MMSNLFPVSISEEILQEFIYELEHQHQSIEQIAIRLEKQPNNFSLVDELKILFTHLMYSSTKLDLIPVSESLLDSITVLESLLNFRIYPSSMSEFILLVIDRLLLLVRDVERHMHIDIRKSQHILVALQYIIQNRDPLKLESGIKTAITAIVQEMNESTDQSDCNLESNITLFDEVELFSEDESEEPKKETINIFLPVELNNPILHARDSIHSYLDNHPVYLLSKISDINMPYSHSHTQFLLELSLAINKLAGEPIDTQDLMIGICIHDIALAAIPDIMNKKEPLTEMELNKIQEHPKLGANLVGVLNGTDTAKEIVLHHHERVDGKGYPDGLVGNSVSDGGKLLAIVDSFNSMTEIKPYRKYPRSMLRAIAEINACIDSQFDHQWVKLFNQCIRNYWLPMRKTSDNPSNEKRVKFQ